MNVVSKWSLLFTVGCVLGAQSLDDPVMKARAQRSQAQGIAEADLPPVPRAVMEPPPLPPPEIHAKDAPHPKVAKAARRRGKARMAKGRPAAAPADPPAAAPKARAARASKAPRTAKHVRPAGKTARPVRKKAKA